MSKNFRVGIGLDQHRIKKKEKSVLVAKEPEKNLVLAGVLVSKDFTPFSDSDGDVVIHSLCNAFSTAIGGGSFDTWAGEMCKRGITDSSRYLEVIVKKLKEEKYSIGNISIMIEAKAPLLEVWREKMTLSLAKLMKINQNQIGMAFTTGQDLTPFGFEEGIQVFSTVLVSQ